MPPDLSSSLKDAEQVEKEKGNRTTLATVDGWLDYKPEEIIDKVSPTPILFVQAEKDELEADDADILFRKAKEPKKLFTLKDGVHFDVYGKRTNEVMKPVLEWFKQYLQRIKCRTTLFRRMSPPKCLRQFPRFAIVGVYFRRAMEGAITR